MAKELFLVWKKDTDEDAEENQVFAISKDGKHKAVVFSDGASESWCYRVDDNETRFDYTSKFDAQFDAEDELRGM